MDQPRGSFQPAALPPPLRWETLVALVGRANASLARYDGLIQGLTHPDVLLAPLSTREAVLSSRIEGTEATLAEVLEEEADPGAASPPRRSDIREILNYRAAVNQAVDKLKTRPLSLNLIRDTHRTLMTGVRGGTKAPGEFRRVQNYIGVEGAGMEAALYVPPPPQDVLPLLDRLEKYIHRDEDDPLVQIALVHAQFELIHPFLDGNGRVGRILIPLFLYTRGLIARPAFYLSAYLEAHRREYYDRLGAVSEAGDYQGWVTFFLTAVAGQAEEDTRRVRTMLELYERLKGVVEGTRSAYALRALDALFASPVFTTPRFAAASGIPPASAGRLLKQLEELGVLQVTRRGRGRRPTVWTFPELMALVG